MADATLTAPQTLAGILASDLVPDQVLSAAVAMFMRRAEMLNVLSAEYGIDIEYADGSNVMRVGNVSSLASLTWSAVGEQGRPVPQSLTTGYVDVTVAARALALSSTYSHAMMTPNNLRVVTEANRLLMGFPDAMAANVRDRVCAVGAGISASVGSTADTSVDTLIAARAYFDGLAPAADARIDQGAPIAFLHPVQVGHIKESAMAHPLIQHTGQGLAGFGFQAGSVYRNFLGLNFDAISTLDVEESGSAKQGFIYERGGILCRLGDTSKIPVPRDRVFLALAPFGIVLQEATSARDQQSIEMQLYQHAGFAMQDTSVARAVKILGDVS